VIETPTRVIVDTSGRPILEIDGRVLSAPKQTPDPTRRVDPHRALAAELEASSRPVVIEVEQTAHNAPRHDTSSKDAPQSRRERRAAIKAAKRAAWAERDDYPGPRHVLRNAFAKAATRARKKLNQAAPRP
jgi:hypothetical protein